MDVGRFNFSHGTYDEHLQKLKLFEAIIIRWRKNPFKTQLTPDYKIDWGHTFEKATLSERASKDIKKAEFMADKVGEHFTGVITSIIGAGFFVMLPDTVEGFVPLNVFK